MSNEDNLDDYKKDLGLKKMLYKYDYENQQLRSQIKALNQRLNEIINQNQKHQIVHTDNENIILHQCNIVKHEMNELFLEIQKVKNEIKQNKQLIHENQRQKCIDLQNELKIEQNKKQILQKQLKQYQIKTIGIKNIKINNNNNNNDNNNNNNSNNNNKINRIEINKQRLNSLQNNLNKLKQKIKQYKKIRNENNNKIIKQHQQVRNLQNRSKNIEKQDQKKNKIQNNNNNNIKITIIQTMQHNQQNYQKIKNQIINLSKQKQIIISSAQNQNQILKYKLIQLNKQLNKQEINIPSLNKYSKTPEITQKISHIPRIPSIKPTRYDTHQFEQNNDKNYVPKNARTIQWNGGNNHAMGIQWSDDHLNSPITGLNLWIDSILLGIQFIHTLGQSNQHIHMLNKKINPIQYRLQNNDYLENIILHIKNNRINGLELISKNNRNDSFGIKKGQKFNFGIKKPQKLLFSMGSFKINTNNTSQIIKLGFSIL